MRKYNFEGVPLADYARHPLLRERLARFRHHAWRRNRAIPDLSNGRNE
jgi:hypothetical protein